MKSVSLSLRTISIELLVSTDVTCQGNPPQNTGRGGSPCHQQSFNTWLRSQVLAGWGAKVPINQGVKHDSLNLPLHYMFGLLVVLASVYILSQ